MRSPFIIACLLSSALLLPCSIRGAEVTLADGGKSSAVICVGERVMKPDDPNISVEQFQRPQSVAEFQRQQLREAVKDLSHYLEKMSGAKIEVLQHSKIPDGSLPIYIGELAVEKFGKPAKSAPFQQGFRVVISPKGVGLLGESDLGTSYAIYELLDRLGCRWFMPSEWGECIPEMKTIRLKEEDFSSAPGTIYRNIWQADLDYKRRNRLGGMQLSASHALDSYISKELLEKHPDWVAVYKGKPSPPTAKWTKPETASAMADTILHYLDDGTYNYSASLSPEDGIVFDESEDPKFDAGDWDPQWNMNSLTDRLMLLCNRIAEKVSKKYPNTLFGVSAYVNYNRPPVREKLHPNIVPVIAPITYCRAHPMTDDSDPESAELRHIVEGWGKAARMTGIYFFGWFLVEQTAPNPMITKWGVDVPFVIKNGCQFFQPETDCNFETTMHALWMGPRLAWNPSLKPADLVADINTHFYGNAAKEMGAYWDYVDHVWIDTKEFSGGGHGQLKRFTPERMKKMRELLDAGIASAKTPQEKFRVAMANESLILFELYMKIRHDLAEGRFARLNTDAATWVSRSHAMAERYRPQYAFSCRMYGGGGMWGNNNGVDGFQGWYQGACDDAARISRFYNILTPQPLRQWKYSVDKEKKAESLGWAKSAFDDKAWKTIDAAVDSLSAIGLHNYIGPIVYRASTQLPAAPPGRRTYLWISAMDDFAKVFVNGKPVPCVAADGKKSAEFEGFMQPSSWDISEAIHDGENQITILCQRRQVNEIGNGGLMGPVVVYRERN